MRKFSHQEIVERQNIRKSEPAVPLTVVCVNIRSLYNVGSIFRTADGAGVEKIWLCGITGCPPQPGICKIALGAEDRVPWEYHADAFTVVRQLKQSGYQIVLLEQMDASVEYHRFKPVGPVGLVVGNEIEGLDEHLVPLADAAIDIYMAGIKNSLNVSVAFGIVAYHLRTRLKG
ncbi:MAG: RNA methyltransferase [Candidatus Omnitrophota bacterium]